jgi:hypothetical protein
VAIVEIIAMAALSFQGQPRDAASCIADEIIGLQHRRHDEQQLRSSKSSFFIEQTPKQAQGLWRQSFRLRREQ